MKIKFNWGTGVVMALLIMMAGMTYLVSIAIRQDHDLVDDNYYQKSINYQQHIDDAGNTAKLDQKLVFTLSVDTLKIQFPELAVSTDYSGEIHFYSPVAAKRDFKLAAKPDTGFAQIIALKSMEAGRYQVKVNWTANSVSYFQEEEILIER